VINIFNLDFQEYIHLFIKYEVEYMLVGGMAVNIHGYRRSTGDMDLFVNPTKENHYKLRKVHSDFGMHMGQMGDLNSFLDTSKYDVFTFGVSPVQIDIMTACKGIVFESAYKQIVTTQIEDNLEINVIQYRDLITAKKASNRIRDKADIEALEKIKKMREEGQ